ncbi:MAG: nucleoside-diphosphate kinase [Amoebophilaceae bacterium TMED152]|nr:MAG: nucleoside-diphosphate kinase [Amoebophilaceae bacterium TMED152]
MVGNKTFSIIKPDAFTASYTGSIIEIIERAGFSIKNMRLVEMDNTMASRFYSIHKERPFFTRLCEYMCSGPIIVIELEKENAVSDFRKLIGSTNPEEAEEGTIRKKFASSIEANAIHGSDSDENAQIEINFFFNN